MKQKLLDQLVHKAGARFGGDGINYDLFVPSKFAELIVRECAKIADDGFASSNFGNGITGHQLLKHFGVEE